MNVKEPQQKKDKRLLGFDSIVVRYIAAIGATAVLLAGSIYAYLYISTPGHIRNPTYQHYHFRTQILVDGNAVDFSKDEFQQEKNPSVACDVDISSTPIHFHDRMDQLTHIHWNGMTGGEQLKNFGWNFIGGDDELLGRRYDTGVIPRPVKIHGKVLPALPSNANFYVYIGDKDSYQQKAWKDFLNQDLETFFGKKSNVGHSEEVSSATLLNWLSPTAYAHDSIQDKHSSEKSEEELTRINNLIGNVVIFVQEKEPTDEQIKTRFNTLVPLQDSTCGD